MSKDRAKQTAIHLAVLMSAAFLCASCAIRRSAVARRPPEPVVSFLQARLEPAGESGESGDTATVVGAVQRPGSIKLVAGNTALDGILELVGGLKPEATGVVRIHPASTRIVAALLANQDPGELSAIELRLEDVLGRGANPGMPLHLWPGDLVEVLPVADATPESVAPPSAVTTELAAKAPPPTEEGSSGHDRADKTARREVASGVELPSAGSDPHELVELRSQVAKLKDELERERNERGLLQVELNRIAADQVKIRQELAGFTPRRPELTAKASSGASRPGDAGLARPAAASPPRPHPEVQPGEGTSEAKEPPAAAEDSGSKPAPTVTVSGFVQRPGAYRVEEVKTVGAAVAAAGKREGANLSAVEVQSVGQEGALLGLGLALGSRSAKTVVDLRAIESGTKSDHPLRGGEVIFVPRGP